MEVKIISGYGENTFQMEEADAMSLLNNAMRFHNKIKAIDGVEDNTGIKAEKEEEIKEEKEKGGNVMEGFAMRELKMEKGSDSAIAVAMPEGSPIFFTANVIACPDDKEVAAMDVDSVMRVIGRMTVDTCQTFLESRRDHSGYDVFWWTLELDAKSTE